MLEAISVIVKIEVRFDTPKESWFVAQYTRNVYAKCFCKEASEHRARGVLRKVILHVSVD